ncbi:hypothetical protein ANN_09761 [Periplaneta americana]|uniref:Reverse transcriptase domain-containing protein n=1 Tax=Periplaneta americana TaxID=6978 RepID=A0ABQ8TPH1_PERAM|nr:hypothetical protein ANN_09761 [Periplaneta americana]
MAGLCEAGNEPLGSSKAMRITFMNAAITFINLIEYIESANALPQDIEHSDTLLFSSARCLRRSSVAAMMFRGGTCLGRSEMKRENAREGGVCKESSYLQGLYDFYTFEKFPSDTVYRGYFRGVCWEMNPGSLALARRIVTSAFESTSAPCALSSYSNSSLWRARHSTIHFETQTTTKQHKNLSTSALRFQTPIITTLCYHCTAAGSVIIWNIISTVAVQYFQVVGLTQYLRKRHPDMQNILYFSDGAARKKKKEFHRLEHIKTLEKIKKTGSQVLSEKFTIKMGHTQGQENANSIMRTVQNIQRLAPVREKLNEENVRCKKKINSLNSIIAHLQKELMINENAATVLRLSGKVFNFLQKENFENLYGYQVSGIIYPAVVLQAKTLLCPLVVGCLQRCNPRPQTCLSQFERHPTQENFVQFKRLRAKARRTVCDAKKTSWTNYVNSMKRNVPSNTVWDKVRRIMGKRSSVIPGIISNGVTTTSPIEIAEIFATSFAQVSSSNNYDPEFLKIKDAAEKRNLHFISDNTEYYNTPFTTEELEAALDTSPNTSHGPDNIHNRMLRHLPPAGKSFLLAMYNRIWTEGVFPSAWRSAIVILVQKPGKDPSLSGSYRPISLTSCVCKVMERMISKRLISAADHLVRLETAIRDAFLKKEHLVAVFFDLENAYNTTWRYGILQTLHDCGLRSVYQRLLRSSWQNSISEFE